MSILSKLNYNDYKHKSLSFHHSSFVPQGLMDQVREKVFGVDLPAVGEQVFDAATELKTTFGKINAAMGTVDETASQLMSVNWRSVTQFAVALRYFSVATSWMDRVIAIASAFLVYTHESLVTSISLVRDFSGFEYDLGGRFSCASGVLVPEGLIESQFTSQAIYKMIAAITSIALMALGYKVHSGMLTSRVSKEKDLIETIFKFGKLSYGMSGVVKIFEAVCAYLRKIVDAYLFENSLNTDLPKEEIIEWYNEVMSFNLDELMLELAFSEYQRTRIRMLRDKRDIFSRLLGGTVGKYSPALYQEFSRASQRILEICEKMKRVNLDYGMRVDPYCVCFTGQPGVGKSFLINEVINRIANQFSIPNYQRIYYRNTSDQYWSGYHHQWCTFLEDFGQERNAMTNVDPFIDFIKIKGNNSYPLTMAELSEKGRYFTSKFIAMTTNFPFPQSNTVNEIGAVWRRRDILIELVAKIDSNALKKVEPNDRDHLIYNVLDPVRPGEYIARDIGWEGVLERTLGGYIEHTKRQEKAVKYMTRFHTLECQGDVEKNEDPQEITSTSTPIDEQAEVAAEWESRRLQRMMRGKNFSQRCLRLCNRILRSEASGYNPFELYLRKLSLIYGAIHYNWRIENVETVNMQIYDMLKMRDVFDRLKCFFGEFWDEWADAVIQDWFQVVPVELLPWRDLAVFICMGTTEYNVDNPLYHGPYLVLYPEGDEVLLDPSKLECDCNAKILVTRAVQRNFACVTTPELIKEEIYSDHVCDGLDKKLILYFATRNCKRLIVREYERKQVRLLFELYPDKVISELECEARDISSAVLKDTWLGRAFEESRCHFAELIDEHVKQTSVRYDVVVEQKPWIKWILTGGAILATLGSIWWLFGKLFGSDDEGSNLDGMFRPFTDDDYENYNGPCVGLEDGNLMFKTNYKGYHVVQKEMEDPTFVKGQGYHAGETRIAPKGSVRVVSSVGPVKVLRGQGVEDSNADDIITKLSYRTYCFQTKNARRVYSQTCLQLVGNIFIVNRHCFATIEKGDEIILTSIDKRQYRYFYDPNQVVALQDHDLAAFKVPDLTLPPGPNLIKNFIKEDDLRFVTNTEVQHIGVRKDYTQFYWQSFVTRLDCKYPMDGQDFYFTKGWASDYDTQKGMCGALTVARNPSIRRKVLGFHAAKNYDDNSSISQLITQEMLDRLCKELGMVDVITEDRDDLLTKPLTVQGEMSLTGNFRVLSDYNGKSSGGKSKIVKSVLYNKVFQPTTDRSVLSVFDWRRMDEPVDPVMKAMKKYSKVNIPMDEDILSEISDHLCAKVRLDKRVLGLQPKVVSEDIAINGIVGDEYYRSLDMASSPGYPYRDSRPAGESGKKYLFENLGTEMEPNYIVKDPELRKNIDGRLAAYKDGRTYPTLWVACPKDERRKFKKIREGKTRVFMAAPVDLIIVSRMYNMDYYAWFYRSKISRSNSTVGIDPDNGKEWTYVYNRLREKGSSVIPGDFAEFDGTIKPEVVRHRQRKVEAFYEGTDEDRRVRMAIINEVIHSCVIYSETVFDIWRDFLKEQLLCSSEEEERVLRMKYLDYFRSERVKMHKTVRLVIQKSVGITSGYDGTVVIDTECNEIYMRYVFQKLGRDWAFYPNDYERKDQACYDKSVAAFFNGDDNIQSPGEHLLWYNASTIAQCLEEYGIIYTLSDKDAEMVDSVDIMEATYLKRKFRPHDDHPHILCAPLDVDSIKELINWTTKSVDPIPQMRSNFYDGLCFAYHHGRAFFEEYRDKVEEAFMHHRPRIKFEHYEYCSFNEKFLAKCT